MTETLHRVDPAVGPGSDRGADATTPALALRPPPERPESEGAAGALLNVVPMLGSLGSIALVSSMGGEHRARGLLAAGLMLFATLGFVVVQVDRQRKQRTRRATGSRDAYRRHLAEVRRAARAVAGAQRSALLARHPDPLALPARAAEPGGLFAGDPGDPGGAAALPVRFGSCSQPLAATLAPPAVDASGAPSSADPAAEAALRRLLAVHRTQPDLPATVDLRAVARIELCGEDAPARSLARSLVCSAVGGHGPGRLAVAVLCGRSALPHWDWVKWLPHAGSARQSDAVGPARLVATDPDRLAALLPEGLLDRAPFGSPEPAATPHLLLVVDGVDDRPAGAPAHPLLPPGGLHGVTLLDLPERWDAPESPTRLRLELPARPDAPDERPPVAVLRPGHEPVLARADRCGPATAEAFARRLARVPAPSGGSGGRPGAGATDPWGAIDPAALDLDARWGERPERDHLRVPIGVADDGTPVHLDLKEAAERGMGPHGLVVGATGSGKSELLRTLVLALALGHPPDRLALVLVDFKGGASFTGLADLPHVSAVITNLEAEMALVERMQDALAGEMVRRQEVLRRSGHGSVRDHERARAAGAGLEPLPSLVVVVDEFSELLAARPELLDLFVAIGRLGRSLGLHLVLASQRLDEGRLRGLEAHLSYRIGLRTFSAAESRTVLGVPDAAALPSTPGVGFLRTDPETLLRFRASHVSGPPPTRAPRAAAAVSTAPVVRPFSVAPVPATHEHPLHEPPPHEAPLHEAPPHEPGASLLDLTVRAMAGERPAARRIWLPPLDRPETLGALMPDLTADPTLGLVSPSWRERGPYVLPLGTLDRPREQRRDPLVVDLRGAAGHLAVAGGPRSGKSTLLRTAVAALALTTTPRETQVLVLDFGGGAFSGLRALPHVAGVATRAEPEVVRRVLAEATAVLDRRERLFREHGIDSMDTYRARRARGEADDGWGDVFVVVDGWSTLLAESEQAGIDQVEVPLRRLATEGLAYGVHLLVATSRWSDLRAGARDAFGSRLELRLGAPLDSEIDRRAAALVPAGRPGRGLTSTPHHFLGALPHLTAQPHLTDLPHLTAQPEPEAGDPAAASTAAVEQLVDRSAAAWAGPRGPRLRLLPRRVELAAVREAARGRDPDGGRILLGIDERDLAPVGLPADEPHLLLLGEGASGKTAALRAYAEEVMRTHGPEEAQLLVVDYRRSLLGQVPDDYLLDHLTSASAAAPALGDLAARLEERLPGPGVTPRQLRDRSWWTGPEVFVVVDDYDLVATTRDSPVLTLEHLLAQARDVGLHLVVARRSGGASRALHEPVLQTLRDLAMPGLLLSGSADEGPLIGPLRPQPAPPGRARLLTRDGGAQVLQLAWSGERE